MTQVDFYVLQEGNRLNRERLACVLAEKAFTKGQRLYIHASSESQAGVLDELLWTFKDISFLPHSINSVPDGEETPILIGWEAAPPEAFPVMINLAHPFPDFLDRFERVIEVVDQDPETRRLARERYRDYQDRGCELIKHDIANA
jgi:DNA polymerase-3 subunit chi